MVDFRVLYHFNNVKQKWQWNIILIIDRLITIMRIYIFVNLRSFLKINPRQWSYPSSMEAGKHLIHSSIRLLIVYLFFDTKINTPLNICCIIVYITCLYLNYSIFKLSQNTCTRRDVRYVNGSQVCYVYLCKFFSRNFI